MVVAKVLEQAAAGAEQHRYEVHVDLVDEPGTDELLTDVAADDVDVLFIRGGAARLPVAGDGLVVVAERAREALREVERREVGRLSQQRPGALAQGHCVDARNASRVEVMLGVRLAVGIEADDCRAIGYVGIRELFMLSQELSAQYPLEHGAPDQGTPSY